VPSELENIRRSVSGVWSEDHRFGGQHPPS